MTSNAGPVAEVDESTLLPALRAGDEQAFQRLTDRYRRGLLLHFYRILRSLPPPEEALQGPRLRAPRVVAPLQGRSGLTPRRYPRPSTPRPGGTAGPRR